MRTTDVDEPRDLWIAETLAELIPAAELAELRATSGRSLWETVVRRGAVRDDELVEMLATRARLRVWDPGDAPDPFAAEVLPEQWARRFHVVPVAVTASTITIATSCPFDLDCEQAIAFATGRSVHQLLASPVAITRALTRAYGSGATGAPEPPALQDAGAADGGMIALVDTLIAEGIAARASDIHLESEIAGLAVKHRIDGLLRHVRTLETDVGAPLVSRIKIMAGLDIADRLRPQDGRIGVAVSGGQVDVRVSTLPAAHGEKVVLRILDTRAGATTLGSLGIDSETLARVQHILDAREGMVLVTGPTGSGKTTTLYAALRAIRERGVNIVTVEDPVEYRLPGIAQVQVSQKTGLTFAAALRSILRQDPDVILIGEIRDGETASNAVQAALTGHLVLSTLHTIDAPSVVARLEDLGVERFKIASALKGALAQRLVRRLCPACRVSDPEAPPLSMARWFPPEVARWRERGCPACGGTGYRGRIALVEALDVVPMVERAIAAGEPPIRIGDLARESGMRRLWDAGVLQVAAGGTSVAELARVVDLPFPPQVESLVRDVRERESERSRSARRAGSVRARAARMTSGRFASLALACNRELAMAEVSIGTIDVYVIRPLKDGWRILAVQRGLDTRCPGAWETVHGRIEPGERPEEAAVREVREETGLEVARLYNVTVQPFYLHRAASVQLAVVFAAFVAEPAAVTLGEEHQHHEWLRLESARERFAWPREKQAIDEIAYLLRSGDAGAVEDVLRVF